MAFSPLPGSRLSSPKWGSPKFCLESPRSWGLTDGLNNNFLDNFFSSEGTCSCSVLRLSFSREARVAT